MFRGHQLSFLKSPRVPRQPGSPCECHTRQPTLLEIMKQNYFIVVFAHSIHGRLRRVHVPHQAIYGILALALLGCFSIFGFISSYARMALKVASYNALKQEGEVLKKVKVSKFTKDSKSDR